MGARHDLSKAIEYDVVVVGAGNAALCAALSARDHDASVLVLEKAAPSDQGGNCPFTGGGFRTVHAGMEDIQTLVSGLTADEASWLTMAPYTADDFRGHLLEVTRGEVDPELIETLIEQSRPTVEWMRDKGVEWQVPERIRSGTAGAPSKVPNSVGVNASGSGPGLVKMLTAAATRNGIDILYQTEMLSLAQDASGRVSGLTVKDSDGVHEIGAGRWCWRAAASRRTPRCAPNTLASGGRGPGRAAPDTTPATAIGLRWPSERRPADSGPAAMRRLSTWARRRLATSSSLGAWSAAHTRWASR